MKKMFIMIAASGMGKSTYCNKLLIDDPLLITCSADHYMVNKDGLYEFKPERLGFAHKTCQEKADKLLEAGFNVVIDNTNANWDSLKPYLNMAQKYSCEVEFHIFTPEQKVGQSVTLDDHCKFLFNRNSHNVPMDAIMRQLLQVDNLRASLEEKMGSVYPEIYYQAEVHPVYVE